MNEDDKDKIEPALEAASAIGGLLTFLIAVLAGLLLLVNLRFGGASLLPKLIAILTAAAVVAGAIVGFLRFTKWVRRIKRGKRGF